MLRPSGDVGRALRIVARLGLPAHDGDESFAAPLPPDAWSALLLHVRAERIAGLLDRAVAGGSLPATGSQAAAAEADAAQGARGCLRLERDLLAVADALETAGVKFRVLKGAAVARLDEPDPALRQYGDVDVFVRGPDLHAATEALATLGYARDLPERRPGFDARFGKEISVARPRGGEVDVHRTLALGALGLTIELDALWSDHESFVVGGRRLVALSAEGRFVQACFNAVLGDEQPRLVALRDVATIALAHRLRPDVIWSISPAGRGAAVVGLALRTVRTTLGVDLGEVVDRLDVPAASAWERFVLRAYRAQGGSNTLEVLSGVAGAPLGQRWLYLRSVLLPAVDYRRARRLAGRPPEWRTGLRELRRHQERVG